MDVLILHSDVAPDAPPDEQDTLWTVDAVKAALADRGHGVATAAFAPAPAHLRGLLETHKPDAVFNLVESVFGLGQFATMAAQMLEMCNVPFTGNPGGAMALAGDKPLTKSLLRTMGLPTAHWVEGPQWAGLDAERIYVVKHATEDASVGMTDDSVVSGARVQARAEECTRRHGGRWFAEEYLTGREFNVSCIEVDGKPRVLPVPEMRFDNWPENRPRLVNWAAKWDEDHPDLSNTNRDFVGDEDAALAAQLTGLVADSWTRFGLRGFARVDFRCDAGGNPMILELNPNPCLESGAGLAAAAAKIGMDYADLCEAILNAAIH
ncbi:MAG: D-alanine--D-alanine ligase family protein [Rhizomicrobium sp.]